MSTDMEQLKKAAKALRKENERFFKNLKKKPPKDLDQTMERLHEEEFRKTDCLTCANCCKTTGPLFTNKDIVRIAKHLKLRPSQFESTYLKKDEDGDLVLQETPCAFLASDNYCLIYEVRPKACKEYPHTNRKNFQQISNLTLQNIAICPATFNIVENMKKNIAIGYKGKRN
ncbi:YkgJ family cysteine cluster protein [Aquimarina sp. ERC-38]|uniref:YkgJ family cysteine cluster protein n=1 Tax=Aquimarina sp. ERC-38 TaxID=2949996 RepID=UPI002246D793|nr:YkgJ family cysteine cluster protein [Aquimarina sp. ERC-38]UZO79383.1 YkgJ family cysteine cluster protein [Aquimarina sp. ERC-38]